MIGDDSHHCSTSGIPLLEVSLSGCFTAGHGPLDVEHACEKAGNALLVLWDLQEMLSEPKPTQSGADILDLHSGYCSIIDHCVRDHDISLLCQTV